jgi:tripartite-type tricarboxylate transporter receptor subunit TctC
MGQWLSERLGQQFVIENRPGGGGNIGTEAVVRAPPDGYTLAVIGAPSAINATLYEKLNFNFIRDITPVASIIRFPNVMVVNPSVPVTTVPEFIAYAKANPGKLNMASPGNGSTPHVTGELFKMMTGINMVHVPYRSVAAGITDMLSGQVQVTFGTTARHCPTYRPLPNRCRTSRRALRMVSARPSTTPGEIVAMLNKEVNVALANAGMQARFAELGGIVLPGSAADYRNLIAAETEKWAKVVKFAGVRVD